MSYQVGNRSLHVFMSNQSEWFSRLAPAFGLQPRWAKNRKFADQFDSETGLSEQGEKTAKKILDLIAVNPFINRKELAEKIGIIEDGIKYHLSNLQKKKRFKRVGPDKDRHWEIIGD